MRSWRTDLSTVYLSLGSNLGDREKNIRRAIKGLETAGVRILKLSSIIETDPVGGPPQGLFLNAAARGETDLSPGDLLKAVRAVEKELGRVRDVPNGPRTIDVDILLYDELTINAPDLVVPHPRMWERDFVTRPLWEIAPELKRHDP